MRRALLAGALLGAVAGLVFVHHDALRLTVAWPIILGFALWEAVGERGSRGPVTAAAAIVGAAAGWVAFAIPTEYLPVTGLSLGIVTGGLVGLMVIGGILARDRFPLSGMLMGFGAFFGVFQPLWNQSPSNFRTHGLENLTVVWLGLLAGVLAAAVVRALTEGVRIRATAREALAEPPPNAPLREMLEGSAGE
jgi:hypothetical protein